MLNKIIKEQLELIDSLQESLERNQKEKHLARRKVLDLELKVADLEQENQELKKVIKSLQAAEE